MQNIDSGSSEDLGRVGPYRLDEPLGSGGMGTVWRAWDERLKRPVALKQLLSGTLDSPTLRERFRREAEAEARLNHPSIVRVYDILATEGGDWIVMELVEGRTLQSWLTEGPLEIGRAIRLGREIAEGLAEAHAHGIIHRDLKASNVMVTGSGHAKILDFGVAKQIQPEAQDTTLSAQGTIVGTSHAMSPEQALGLRLDGRSDLFSFGSLLYEMLTGVPPFRAETGTATLARVCSYRQPPVSELRPEVPQELSDLVDRLLEKDPVYRPQSAEELAAALDRLGGGEGLSTRSREGPLPSRQSVSETPTLLDGSSAWRSVPAASPAPGPVAPGSSYASAHGPSRRWVLLAAAGLLLSILIVVWAAISRPAAPAVSRDPYQLYQDGLSSLERYDKPGHLDQAIEAFQRAIALDPAHAPAHAGLAKAYWWSWEDKQDRMLLEQALAAAERAVQLDSHLAIAHVNLGLAYASTGELDKAEKTLERALLLDPLDPDAHFAAGYLSRLRGRRDKAENQFRKAIELRPTRLYHDELGALYLENGDLDRAEAAFRASIRLAPDSYFGHRNLGVLFYAKGRLPEAAAEFQKALQIRPQATLYSNLGGVYFTQGLYQEAVAAFEKAIELPGGSSSALIWGNLGDAYRWTPDNEQRARDAYLRAIQILRNDLGASPRSPRLRSRLALFLAKRGDREEAIEEISGTEKLTGLDPTSRYRLAQAYEVLGDRNAALAALGEALRAGLSVEEVGSNPELSELRGDVRYQRMIAAFLDR